MMPDDTDKIKAMNLISRIERGLRGHFEQVSVLTNFQYQETMLNDLNYIQERLNELWELINKGEL